MYVYRITCIPVINFLVRFILCLFYLVHSGLEEKSLDQRKINVWKKVYSSYLPCYIVAKSSQNCTVISTVHNTITDTSCVKSGVDLVINCALYNFYHRITAMYSYLLVLLCQVTSQFVIKAIQFCQHNYKI